MNRLNTRPNGEKRALKAPGQPRVPGNGVLALIIISGLLVGMLLSTVIYIDDLLEKVHQVNPGDAPWNPVNLSLDLQSVAPYEDKTGQDDTPGLIDAMSREAAGVKPAEPVVDPKARQVLLIVAEEWDEESVNRPDAIVLLTFHHTAKEVRLTSFMRNMAVEIPGMGWSMLAHAYGRGGPPLLCRTIEDNLRITLDDYLLVDMAAFKRVVDRIGGIDLELSDEEELYLRKNYPYRSIQTGVNEIDGELAVTLSRLRLTADESERLDRQRKVTKALLEAIAPLSGQQRIRLLIGSSSKITTNLDKSEIFDLVMDGYKARNYAVRQLALPDEGYFRPVVLDQVVLTRPDLVQTVEALHEFVFAP